MKKISLFLYRISKLWLAALLTALMVVYAAVVMKSTSGCFSAELSEGQNIPGLQFGYSLHEVILFFDTMSIEGRKCYKEFLSVWDSLFPLLYGTMYMIWLSLIYKKSGKDRLPLLLINLYPLLPMCADWLENITELQLIAEYNASANIRQSSAKIASLITQIKWILSALNYLIILWGIFFLFRNGFKYKK